MRSTKRLLVHYKSGIERICQTVVTKGVKNYGKTKAGCRKSFTVNLRVKRHSYLDKKRREKEKEFRKY